MEFADRVEAGRRLAHRLEHLRGRDAVVLGLPRGGVPVAAEVARHLGLPLDVIVVRKLGLPSNAEVAMGAVGEGGVRYVDDALVTRWRVDAAALAAVERRETAEVERRTARVRATVPRRHLAGRVALIVDDGIATGSTMIAACRVARAAGAASVVVAAPVAPPDVVEALSVVADEVVCAVTPPDLRSVGSWYRDFSPTTEDEVLELLTSVTPAPVTRRPDAPPGRRGSSST